MPLPARSPIRAAALVALAIGLSACDVRESGVSIVASSGFAPSGHVAVAVIPATTLPFQILPALGCPLVAPFRASLSIFVDPLGVDLFLQEVGLQFADTAGFVSPLVYRQADLARLFGSTHVGAGHRRAFAFQPEFGCGFRTAPHTMSGRIVLHDRRGGRHERSIGLRLGGK